MKVTAPVLDKLVINFDAPTQQLRRGHAHLHG